MQTNSQHQVLVIIKDGLGKYSSEIENHPDRETAKEVARQLNQEKREPDYNVVAICLDNDLEKE